MCIRDRTYADQVIEVAEGDEHVRGHVCSPRADRSQLVPDTQSDDDGGGISRASEHRAAPASPADMSASLSLRPRLPATPSSQPSFQSKPSVLSGADDQRSPSLVPLPMRCGTSPSGGDLPSPDAQCATPPEAGPDGQEQPGTRFEPRRSEGLSHTGLACDPSTSPVMAHSSVCHGTLPLGEDRKAISVAPNTSAELKELARTSPAGKPACLALQIPGQDGRPRVALQECTSSDSADEQPAPLGPQGHRHRGDHRRSGTPAAAEAEQPVRAPLKREPRSTLTHRSARPDHSGWDGVRKLPAHRTSAGRDSFEIGETVSPVIAAIAAARARQCSGAVAAAPVEERAGVCVQGNHPVGLGSRGPAACSKDAVPGILQSKRRRRKHRASDLLIQNFAKRANDGAEDDDRFPEAAAETGCEWANAASQDPDSDCRSGARAKLCREGPGSQGESIEDVQVRPMPALCLFVRCTCLKFRVQPSRGPFCLLCKEHLWQSAKQSAACHMQDDTVLEPRGKKKAKGSTRKRRKEAGQQSLFQFGFNPAA